LNDSSWSARLVELPLGAKDETKVVQGRQCHGVIRAKDSTQRSQGILVQLPRARQISKVPKRLRDVVHRAEGIPVIRPKDPLSGAQHFLVKLMRPSEVSLRRESHPDVVERRERIRMIGTQFGLLHTQHFLVQRTRFRYLSSAFER